MAKKGSNPGKKLQYKKYYDEGRWLKNKEARVERHRKRHPNDDVNPKYKYTRNKNGKNTLQVAPKITAKATNYGKTLRAQLSQKSTRSLRKRSTIPHRRGI